MRLLIAVVVAVAVGFDIAAFLLYGGIGDWEAWAVLLVLATVSWATRVSDVKGQVLQSFLNAIALAAIVLVGPLGAGLIAAAAGVWDRRSGPVRVRLYNAAMSQTAVVVGGLAYELVGGQSADQVRHLDGVMPLLFGVGFPLILADLALALVNALLLTLITSAARGAPVVPLLLGLLRGSGSAYVGYGVIGFLFAVLWLPAQLGVASALLIAAPLFVARWALLQHAEELRIQEMSVNALVAAVEAKDPSCVGHGERVGVLSGWIGEELGLAADAQQLLVAAATLHDIGRVTLPSHLLWPIEPPTGEDIEAIKAHTVNGVALIEGIEFLTGARAGILHHHERFDGTGYPDGLSGDRIPLSARIIAVADAFDVLLTNADESVTAMEILEELRQRSGSHLDPAVVEYLAAALSKHEWPPELPPDQLTAETSTVDHDNPAVSDWIAAHDSDLTSTPRGLA